MLVYQRVYGFTMSYRLRTDDVTMKTGDLRIHTLTVVIDEGLTKGQWKFQNQQFANNGDFSCNG